MLVAFFLHDIRCNILIVQDLLSHLSTDEAVNFYNCGKRSIMNANLVVAALLYASSAGALMLQPAIQSRSQQHSGRFGKRRSQNIKGQHHSNSPHCLAASPPCSFPMSMLASSVPNEVLHPVPPNLLVADQVVGSLSYFAIATSLGFISNTAWGIYRAKQKKNAHMSAQSNDETNEVDVVEEEVAQLPFSDHISNVASIAFAAEAAAEAARSLQEANEFVEEAQISAKPSENDPEDGGKKSKVTRALLEDKLKHTQHSLEVAAVVFSQMDENLDKHLDDIITIVEQKASTTMLSQTELDAAADALWVSSLENQVAALLGAASEAIAEFPPAQEKNEKYPNKETLAAVAAKTNEILANTKKTNQEMLQPERYMALKAKAEEDAEAIEEIEEGDLRHEHEKWRPLRFESQ